MTYRDRENQIVQSGIGQFKLASSRPVFKLSWTHYQVLMRIAEKEEREFYEKESIRSNWNVCMLIIMIDMRE